MDKILVFFILSASPAENNADARGSWARLSWRAMQQDEKRPEAEQHQRQLETGKSQSQLPPSQEEMGRPRFAPEFDGLDCFETIIWR
ncbi:uncharacterized protein LOC125525559 [Triticum urartu]|uniref:uncharacterized protein LOC125525559 n=1 Tax=Triticum urartu TaxID=4572 RepID=UPI002044CA3A|nr:uncharacterized protein LOC125525559 [Triticum urartu]